jgi:DNA-directed RNA polymerase subunit RPC12/RpoP
MNHVESDKNIIFCENCKQKLRIPKIAKKMEISCPTCKYKFFYKYSKYFFSSDTRKQILIGLIGGFFGFGVTELFLQFIDNQNSLGILSSVFTFGIFAAFLTMTISASDGFIIKNSDKMKYGIKAGFIFGLLGGAISGFIAQILFSLILSYGEKDSFSSVLLARTLGWSLMGGLIGLSYGVKENTYGDIKYGFLGGAVGGAIGGLLFDPIGMLFSFEGDSGLIARLVGFTIIGIAITIAIKRFRDNAIINERPEMYSSISQRLPTNIRLELPDKRK